MKIPLENTVPRQWRTKDQSATVVRLPTGHGYYQSSDFLAFCHKGNLIIVEFTGDEPAKRFIYRRRVQITPDDKIHPVTLTLTDNNKDLKVHVEDVGTFFWRNNGYCFDERG